MVVLVGGVDGMVVDAAGTVEVELVVVVGLVISVNGFLQSPLPNGTFFLLLIGFCANIRAICGLTFPVSVDCAVLVIVGTIGVAWLLSALLVAELDDDDDDELLILESLRKFPQ
jgi:hypothetical protein